MADARFAADATAVNVLYTLNGRPKAPERDLPLAGYRGSRPVRVGNAAASQVQLDVYGHVLHSAWLHVAAGGRLPGGAGRRLAATADLVSVVWEREDSGIWEVRSSPRHFTESKMMCWIALDRACRLAEPGDGSRRRGQVLDVLEQSRCSLRNSSVARMVAPFVGVELQASPPRPIGQPWSPRTSSALKTVC